MKKSAITSGKTQYKVWKQREIPSREVIKPNAIGNCGEKLGKCLCEVMNMMKGCLTARVVQ